MYFLKKKKITALYHRKKWKKNNHQSLRIQMMKDKTRKKNQWTKKNQEKISANPNDEIEKNQN
jgi:hypothetical protein